MAGIILTMQENGVKKQNELFPGLGLAVEAKRLQHMDKMFCGNLKLMSYQILSF